MPTSPLPRWQLASMQAPALITRASSSRDGSLNVPSGPTGRREIIMVAMPGVLIGGIVRGAGFQGTVVCTRTPGAHQPLLGSQALARDPCLYPAHDHLDVYRPLLTVSHREAPPGCRIKRLAPISDRLPGGLGATATP